MTTHTPQPLNLTIRFSSSIPDLDLDIENAQQTTILTLKHTLRTRLSVRSRLRLIYQGRLLPDASALSSVLKTPPPPSDDDNEQSDPKGKGKAAVGAKPVLRVYVNCSLGDELGAKELEDEARESGKPPAETIGRDSGSTPLPSTKPQPRGFDRFLSQGFTSTDVATLRTQFASIHADRFSTDEPPSPDTQRRMEDDWLDNNNANEAALPNPSDDDPSGLAQGLDTLIRGMAIGFFWPLGCLFWGLRLEGQESMWGDRWKTFVASGAVLSLTTGIIMSLSGDEARV